jgi:hypothetical protein
MRSLRRYRSFTIRSKPLLVSGFITLGSTSRGEQVLLFVFPAGRDNPDLNQIVGNHTEPDPALHAVESTIQAAPHPVSPFQGADAPLASGSPPLPTTKPTLPIKSFAFRTLGLLIRHRKPPHSHGAGSFFILLRVEPRIPSHQRRTGRISAGEPRSTTLTTADRWDARQTLRNDQSRENAPSP